MSYPNSALSVGQLVIIAVVVLGCLIIWLTAVYVAARSTRNDHQAEVKSLPSRQRAAHKKKDASAA